MTKQEYRSIAFAIMAATSLTVGSAATVYADGIEDTAKTEHNAADAVAAEAAASAPVGKDKKPEAAITAGTVGTASQDEEDAAMKAWKASRPEEKSVTDGMQALEGKTIVDIVCTGTSEATAATAKAAIAQRAGDSFSTSALEKDRAAVYATGYFYDLYPTFEQVPEGVVITYHLLENPVLKSVTIKGNTVEKTDVLQNMITVKPGMILNGTELQKNIRDMEAQYRKDGYILAKISDLHINRDGALNIVVNEGILEDFKVKGNTKTKDYVVLREMRLKKGEPFNVKKARRSMQRVYNLGFFEDVNMKLNPGVAPNAIVLEIDVVEKRTGSFGIGAGYSSQDGMVGMISLGDTNFRGTGDAVSVQYEFSGDDSDAHGYTFSWRHPYMDKKETVGTFRVYNRTYEYYDYDTNGDEKESYMRKYSGGEITLGRPVSEYSTNYITLRNRNDKYEKHEDDGNVVTKNANGTINWGAHDQKWKDDNFGLTRSITLEHVTDTRDNIYFPTTGGKVSLSAEIAGLGGDFDYRKYIIEDQRYFKVGHAQVIALRGQYGYGDGNIPESAQFRIGGQDSLRGYRDDQFRGDNMCLATLEYRFPIVSKVQGALFTDWGTAWNGGWRPEDIHGSIGVGLQLQTPLGPLRLDYAHGSQRNRLHFSVGGTF